MDKKQTRFKKCPRTDANNQAQQKGNGQFLAHLSSINQTLGNEIQLPKIMKKSTPPQALSSNQLSLPLAFVVTSAISLAITGVMFFITFLGLLWYASTQVKLFTTAAQTTPETIVNQIMTGWQQLPIQTENRKNILLLGIDSLETRGDAPILSDTILLLSLDLRSGKIYAVSFPRDVWNATYQQRINRLYMLGLENKLMPPETLIAREIESLSSIPIHHTLTFTFTEVAEIIDLLGGVEVDVPEGFVDELFPRPDVDVTQETDPAILYQRVEFVPGKQVMTGERALQYIRSRHSLGSQGNDTARNVRQQLVIASLLTQSMQRKLYLEPQLLGSIYAYYNRHFASALSVTELLATAKVLLPYRSQIEFHGGGLPIFPDDPSGVLYHPPESTTQGAWVYRIKDMQAFKTKVREMLELN